MSSCIFSIAVSSYSTVAMITQVAHAIARTEWNTCVAKSTSWALLTCICEGIATIQAIEIELIISFFDIFAFALEVFEVFHVEIVL